MKEFNLSELGLSHKEIPIEKAHLLLRNPAVYKQKDIKEFIKRENELIILFVEGKISKVEFFIRRDKLAGDKLIK